MRLAIARIQYVADTSDRSLHRSSGMTIWRSDIFAVSGFLITSTALHVAHALECEVADFYRLRVARIAPLLLALLVVRHLPYAKVRVVRCFRKNWRPRPRAARVR